MDREMIDCLYNILGRSLSKVITHIIKVGSIFMSGVWYIGYGAH